MMKGKIVLALSAILLLSVGLFACESEQEKEDITGWYYSENGNTYLEVPETNEWNWKGGSGGQIKPKKGNWYYFFSGNRIAYMVHIKDGVLTLYKDDMPVGTYVKGGEPPRELTTGLEYDFEEGVCAVTGIGSARGKHIVIPSEHLGHPVTKVGGYAFEGCGWILSVTIPDSVTWIDGYAFSGCESLQEVNIPSSVTRMDRGVFKGCASLVEVVIPDSVTDLDGEEMFMECSSLTSVTLPDSLENIGPRMFRECSSLAEFDFPESVTSIKGGAFFGCTSLKSLVIPAGVTQIEGRVFRYCGELESIVVEEGNEVYRSEGNCLIKKNDLVWGCKNSVIPAGGGVSGIAEGAFSGCSGLTSLTIPEGVVYIGKEAFAYCKNLAKVKISYTVKSIGSSAFSSCTALEKINIPVTVTSMGNAVFGGCFGIMIFCEADQQPEGWSQSWNGAVSTVVWSSWTLPEEVTG